MPSTFSMVDQPPAGAPRVLLVGKGSHLAGGLLARPSPLLHIDAVSHTVDFDAIDLQQYSTVVNMAYHPQYMREAYVEELDFDLAMARRVARSRAHFVMMSTRRVYGQPVPFRIAEDCTPSPQDHYGRNKLRTELAVQDLLGTRATILRVANVFGFEPGRHTFFGIALRSLQQNRQIVLDTSPFVRRDFIHIEDFADTLLRVLAAPPPGLFNLGSGHAIAIGQMALWIIEGYGEGSLVSTSPAERDSFELNIDKLTERIGSTTPSIHTSERCIEIGKRLKNA